MERAADAADGRAPTVLAVDDVYYPESDGEPMGETEDHVREILRLFQMLDELFTDRPDVYVGADLLLYYVEGDPRRFIVPDVFVAVGAAKLPRRRIYKLWEEPAPPTFVIEVTSASSWVRDEREKPALYARLGVREYVVYDPLGEYLRPALRGFRLAGDTYESMATDMDGALISSALGLRLRLVDGTLRLFDRESGAALLTAGERAAAAEERAAADALALRAAERRIAELEARLRERDERR